MPHALLLAAASSTAPAINNKILVENMGRVFWPLLLGLVKIAGVLLAIVWAPLVLLFAVLLVLDVRRRRRPRRK